MVKSSKEYVPIKRSRFAAKVFNVVAAIPAGQVLTYKQVAARAGRPRAYRAVGNILSTNYDPEIPCHRVIRSDGTSGGYNRGATLKKKILEQELKAAG